jgi:outer membrane protein assembly factor BamB
MAITKKILVIAILFLLLASTIFASTPASKATSSAQVNTNTTSTNSNLNQYEWPQFQGDSSFTRFSEGPAPDTSNILWKANITGIQPYITAFNGMIFVGTNTSIVAVDQTGKIVWSTDIPMNKTWPIAYKIDDTHMIVEGSCLNISTGKLLWSSSSFSSDTGIFNANVYSPEEKLFYVKLNSYIQAWNFSDPSRPPALAWQTYIPGGGITGIGTTYGDGMVFTGSFENQQLALNASTGKILWDTLTKGPMIFDGAYSDGRYFQGGTDDNTLYCFNAANGQILWTYTPPSDPNGYFTTGPALAYGNVYEMNKDGYLYAINQATGNLVWKYKGPDSMLVWPGMPTIADSKVYVTTGEKMEYNAPSETSEYACLNASTGQVIWTLPIEALPPRESAIVAYGTLYIIPGSVTTAVDTTSGTEYSTDSQLWAIGATSTPTPTPPMTPTPTATMTPTPTPTSGATITPIPTSTVSNWTMWRADPTHSSTATVGPSNLTLAWKFTTKGSVISSPSIVDGVVYAGSQDKNIYSINAENGNLIWKYTTGGPVISSPAVAGGKVFVGSEDGYVYCLDANKGTLLWQTFVNSNLTFTFGDLVLKSSPVVSGGVVYVGSLDGYLYALNANNGNIVWKTKTNGPIESSPAFADGAVYFTSQEPSSGMLYKLDANTGNVIWNLTLPYQISFVGGTEMLGSPSVAAGMVFASSDWGAYYAVNESTGQVVWDFIDPAAIEFIVSSPIYVNGDLFIIDKFNIVCLNATSGHTFWSAYTGDELYVSPSYADGKIYVTTSQRHIFVLDTTANGLTIANATTPSSSWSSPSIANGRLYIGCNDWNIYCFSEGVSSQASSQNVTLGHDLVIVVVAVATVVVVALFTVSYVTRKKTEKSSTASANVTGSLA